MRSRHNSLSTLHCLCTRKRPRFQPALDCVHSIPHRQNATNASSWHAQLRDSLVSRRIPLIFDDLVPGPSHRLAISLASYLPSSSTSKPAPPANTPPPPSSSPSPSHPTPSIPPEPTTLSPGHHLVYFNPAFPSTVLLPDATDPTHHPGPPFTHRLWAGGALRFKPGCWSIPLDGARWVCVEGIRDVRVSGKAGEEKVWVDVERRFGRCVGEGHGVQGKGVVAAEDEERIRRRLWSEEEVALADAVIMEMRTLVFLRNDTRAEDAVVSGDGAERAGKIIRGRSHQRASYTLPVPLSTPIALSLPPHPSIHNHT